MKYKVGDTVRITSDNSDFAVGTKCIIDRLTPGDKAYIIKQDNWICDVCDDDIELVSEAVEKVDLKSLNESFKEIYVETIVNPKLGELGVLNGIDLDQVSKTGSIRKNSGKTEFSNLDPKFIKLMAELMTVASKGKYTKFNWAKGNNWSVPLDSLERHLDAIKQGEYIDEETNLPHAVAIAINAMFFDFYRRNFPELNDQFFADKK